MINGAGGAAAVLATPEAGFPPSGFVEMFYLAALPKAASSFAWLVASALQEADGRARPERLPPETPDPYLPLPPLRELLPTGGVYKSHAPWGEQTAGVLNSACCKYAVLLRHPAD